VPIVAQRVTATSDSAGDAVFVFPTPPQGSIWCGTTNVLLAPSTAMGVVTAGGSVVGSTVGYGTYGPWTCNYSEALAISVSGLTPDTQYTAVWHADTEGASYSTYPAAITQVVTTSLVVPQPLEVEGTGPGGEVIVAPALATSVGSGQVAVTTTAAALPSHAASVGVIVAAAASNTGTIEIGPAGVAANTGLILAPGEFTPLLPVANSDVLFAVAGSNQELSFLVL
jgi:hypothetical protein